MSEQVKSLDNYFGKNEINKDVFKNKYLRNENDTVEKCFQNIVDEAFSVSLEQNNPNLEQIKKDFYDLLYEGYFRPGGSIINGLNFKERKISLMNCTTLVIPGDTLEDIFTTLYQAAKMAAYRQGLGVLFKNLRPKGTKINNSAEISQGSVHWMKPFNNLGEWCGQKKRKPAILGAQICSHPDIFEFISCKDDLNEFNNMNLSVQLTDKFMEAVINDDDWELKFETDEINVSKIIKARELFEKLSEHAWKTGEPGVIFIDRMRKWSIQEAFGYKIENVNACSEKPLPKFGVCLLGSINLGKLPLDVNSDEFHSKLKKIINLVVRFFDNIINYEIEHEYKSPIKEQLKIVKDLREFGLGVTNLHEWLFNKGLKYDSDEAIKEVDKLFEYITYYTWKASIQLASERGPCPAYIKCRENNSIKETEYLKFIFERFPELKEKFYRIGIRNSAFLSIAPTGSLSLTFPNTLLSSGIEPLMAPYYWRKTRATNMESIYEYYFTIPDKVKELCLSKIKESNDPEKELDFEKMEKFQGSAIDNDGEIGKSFIKLFNKYRLNNLLQSSHTIDPFQKVKLMSTIQKWVDAAISVTYNLPENYSKEKIQDLYLFAYKNNLKSMTVYRDGSREGIFIFKPPKEYEKRLTSLLNNKPCNCKERPDDIVYHCSPKRPEVLPCNIHHCMVKGKPWVVLIGLFKGKPYEIFAGEYDKEIMYIPKTVKKGFIRKTSSNSYNLEIKIRRSKIVYEKISYLFMNEEFRALTRLLSLHLRNGTYIEFIVEQIRKSNPELTDFYAVVARVLSNYIKKVKLSEKDNKCPECGENSLVREGGCIKCINNKCNYSRCD